MLCETYDYLFLKKLQMHKGFYSFSVAHEAKVGAISPSLVSCLRFYS